MKWQLVAAHAVRLRIWDGELIVFNFLSGDTHLLGDIAGYIVVIMQHSAVEQQAIAAALCHQADCGSPEEINAQVESVFAELKMLNLIEEAA
jgi:PqqD family protein of HPr-rel-A system